jgi:hypothetical protein
VHAAHLWIGRERTELSVTGRCRDEAVMELTWNRRVFRRCAVLLTSKTIYEEFTNWTVSKIEERAEVGCDRVVVERRGPLPRRFPRWPQIRPPNWGHLPAGPTDPNCARRTCIRTCGSSCRYENPASGKPTLAAYRSGNTCDLRVSRSFCLS